MGIKIRPRVNKKLLAVVAFIGVVVAVAAVAYRAGQANPTAKIAGNTANQQNTDQVGEGSELELAEPGRSVFEDYKKKIEENKLEGIEKTTLYINAAFSGASIKAPEAASYAKEALAMMPSNMRNESQNQEMISNLQLIADGKYDQVKVSR